MWTPQHHLFFTFFRIDLQTKLEAPKPSSYWICVTSITITCTVQAFDFRTTTRNEPFLHLFHCLYVYPLTVNLSRKRNLFIQIELRKDDADARKQPLEAMHPREPGATFQKWAHTQVASGTRVACYHDEIKVSLPSMWTPQHHRFFTFFCIDLQTKLEAPKPVVIGYASLPLSSRAQYVLLLVDFASCSQLFNIVFQIHL